MLKVIDNQYSNPSLFIYNVHVLDSYKNAFILVNYQLGTMSKYML